MTNYEKVEIDNLDVNAEAIENLLHVYRVRFEQNDPN